MGQPLHLITAQRYAEMVMFTGITLAMTETSSTETDAAALVNLKALIFHVSGEITLGLIFASRAVPLPRLTTAQSHALMVIWHRTTDATSTVK